MQETAFEIGARSDLDDSEALIVDAFAAQRRRLLRTARMLDADEWSHPSRCSAWNAHEVLIHVLGATRACRTTITGEDAVFGGGFDPNSSPNQFVDERSSRPVVQSLADLESEIDATVAVIETQRAQPDPVQVTAVWGDPVDWRLFVTHMFFDGWVHERDLLLPLGRTPDLAEGEARLGTAYGLHTAGIVAGLFGIPLDATFVLDGAGTGSYRLRVDHRDVRVAVGPPLDATATQGDAVTVTDSIMGREPALASVLDAPPDVIDALSGVGTFLRG
jgi:uncharacterized protein (TIGR03083 family)